MGKATSRPTGELLLCALCSLRTPHLGCPDTASPQHSRDHELFIPFHSNLIIFQCSIAECNVKQAILSKLQSGTAANFIYTEYMIHYSRDVGQTH